MTMMTKTKTRLGLLSLLALLAVGAIASATAGAAPNWQLIRGGVRMALGKGIPLDGSMNQATPFKLEFKVGGVEGAFECEANFFTKSSVKLLGGNPGTDKIAAGMFNVLLLPIFRNNCKVLVEGAVDEECELTKAQLTENSNSKLESIGELPYDNFEEFAVNWEVISPRGMCPAAFVKVYKMTGSLKGKFGGVTLTFNNAAVTLSGTTEPKLSGKYHFDAPRLNGVTKGAEWEVEEKALASGETDGIAYGTREEVETKSASVNDTVRIKSEIAKVGVTIECNKVDGEGTIFGGKPGTEETSFELGQCAVVGQSKCAVAEPISIRGVKSELIEKGSTFYDKFPAIEARIEIKGAACVLKSTSTLSGALVGRVNNSGHALEFTEPAQEGSSLKLAGSTATLISSPEVVTAAPVEAE